MDYTDYFNRNADSEGDFSSWEDLLGKRKTNNYETIIRRTCPEIIQIKEEIKRNRDFSYIDYIMNNSLSFLKTYRESSENSENNILDILRKCFDSVSIENTLTFKEIYNNLYTSDKKNPYDLFKNKKKKDIINIHHFLLNNNQVTDFLNQHNLNLSDFIKDTETFYVKHKHYPSCIIFLNQQHEKGLSLSHASSLLSHCNLSAYVEYISVPLFKELVRHGYDFSKNKAYVSYKKTYNNKISYSLSFEEKEGSKNFEAISFMTVCALKNNVIGKYIIQNKVFDHSTIEKSLDMIRDKKFNIPIDILNIYEKLYLNNTIEKNTIKHKIARI